MNQEQRIQKYLDEQKIPGWKTTMDIARSLDIRGASARRALRELRIQGTVVNRDSHPMMWRSKRLVLTEMLVRKMEEIEKREQ
jgi:hypothetical protein